MSSSEVSFSIEMFSSGLSSAEMHVERESFGGLVEHALRLLRLFQQVGDLGEGGDPGRDSLPQQAADFIQHHQPAGIADGDHQPVFQLLQGHEVIAKHHVDGHAAEELVLDAEVLQVDELAAIAMGQRLGPRGLVGFWNEGSEKCGAFGHTKLLTAKMDKSEAAPPQWPPMVLAWPREKIGR